MSEKIYYVATSEEMQRLDSFIMKDLGVPPEVLMERAGLGVAEIIKTTYPLLSFRKVLVIAGPGNNGGDGFVCARYLWNWGYEVEVLLFGKREKYSQEAKRNLELLEGFNLPLREMQDFEELKNFLKYFQPQLLVDALFGTGLTRPLSGIYEDFILFLKEYQKNHSFKVIAIDMPSGISADTGQILGVALKADITVTFECFKMGQLIYPGKEYVGEIRVIEIGYPWRYLKESERIPKRIYLEEKAARALYQPRRGFYHKGKAGHLLILAGSTGKSGAGYLTALGALKVGAGLVTLASTKSLQSIYSSMLPEALTLGLPERDGEVSEEGIEMVLSALSRKKALVIGPGFGLGEGPQKILFSLLEKATFPMVLDADALTLISSHLDKLKSYPYPKILTPHPGEAARLLSCEPIDILKDPLSAIQKLITLTSATIVLKGPHTIIGGISGEYFISSIDEPGMAQGGMGDILSGILGALLAQGYPPLQASALGVYLHGATAKLLRKTYGPYGFTAKDLAQDLPKIIKTLEEN